MEMNILLKILKDMERRENKLYENIDSLLEDSCFFSIANAALCKREIENIQYWKGIIRNYENESI